jgi:predicted transcriptional regulator
MAISAQRFTVSTSAVALNTASQDGTRLIIKNTSANAADLGASTVTAAAGFDLATGATVTITLKAGDVLYAIRSGASDATLAVERS